MNKLALRPFFVISLFLLLSFTYSAFGQRNGELKREDNAKQTAAGGPLLIDNFDYSTGTLTTVSGATWVNFSGTGNFIQVTSGSLTYSGYPSSGVGNKADIISVGTSAEDAYRQFATQTSGRTYVAFLVNVANVTGLAANASTTGDYFAGILPSSSTTALNARVSIRLGVTAGTFQLGLRATSANAATVFSTTDLTPGTTYLVVLSYELVAGNSNDPINMWIDPTIGGSEPAPTLTQTTATTTDNADVARFFLRQGTTTTPNASIDGVRVGTSWEDVTGSAGPPPSPAKLFTSYLNGANEVGPVATNATGFGRVFLNDAETQITASVYYNNLSSGTTLGHIHGPATVTGTAPPIFNLNPTAGQTSGSVIDAVFAVTPQQVADLKAGLWYFNIHTTNFGGGEIRGQIFPAKAHMDTEGDGRSDYVVVRDSNGPTPGGLINWHVMLHAGSAFYQAEWGLVLTDDVAPADYDGDRRTDIAVWRQEALATFYIIRSATNTIYVDQLGLGTDTPMPGDYNGDGLADTAVKRSNGNGTSSWYYRPDLASNFVTLNLNADGEEAPGDYDGDGRNDPAVFSNGGATGQFNILLSGGGTSSTNYGLPTDLVAPGDYDGDGKTDLCVIRADGTLWRWDFDPSATPGTTVVTDTWGLVASDIPVPADHNGDGRWDYAIWRNSAQGEFFVMTPITRQISQRQWGLAGDFPAGAIDFEP